MNYGNGTSDANLYAGSSQALTLARTFMARVFGWMTLGLVVTGASALWVFTSPEAQNFIFGSKVVFYGLIIAQVGIVLLFSAALRKFSSGACAGLFLFYSALMGLTLSSVFLIYELGSVAQTFFIAAGTFGGMAAFGYVTKSDLSKAGAIAGMALIGVLIASVVNIFMGSGTMDTIISFVGVLVFVVLTAWDVQKLKAIGSEATTEQEVSKYALMGALTLYLDFINLFLFLLRFFGQRKD
ncbi:MAG: Bax inhibitor-1/YccA family protein [Planctomycetes bacterium]|nr:Bax inhibitor-1/YccA family protein [Planctomycetota bacterium]